MSRNILNYLNRVKKQAQRGDTIVEVMIATAILAIVLATAYATSNHSLQTGFNSQYRDQALSYAQQQVELIKNADANSSSLSTYQQNQFCIDPSSSQIQAVDSNSHTCPWPVGTSGSNPSQYSLVDNYNSSTQTYSATVQWTSSTNVTNQVTLYYKAHNSFVTTTNAFSPPTAPTQTTPPTVGITFTADSTNLSYGGSTTLRWSASNASSCTASGGWRGSKSTTPNSESTGPLSSTTTYTLSCTNGGSTNQQSVTVNVATLPLPVITGFSADNNPIDYGSSTTMRWSASGASSCNGDKFSTGGATSGSAHTADYMTASTTYTLTCTNAAGGTSSRSLTVSVLPYLNFWADNYNISYGGGTTLRWSSANATSCYATGAWVGWVSLNGASYTGSLTSSRTYYLTCFGDGGSKQKSVTINVSPPPPVPQVETLPPYFSGSTIYFQSYINPQGTYTNYYYRWSIDPNFGNCVLYDNDPGGFHLDPQDYNWHYDSSWGRTTINGVTTPVNYYNCNSHTYYVQACAYNSNGTACGIVYQFSI